MGFCRCHLAWKFKYEFMYKHSKVIKKITHLGNKAHFETKFY